MREEKNKLGITEWVVVFLLSSLLLYTADYTENVGSYKSRIFNLILTFLNSNVITYWAIRVFFIFAMCFSLYKIVKLLLKKR